jgi:hypothetical protein
MVSGFRKADEAFLAGCAWLGRTVHAFGRSLIGRLGRAGAWAGSQALRLGLMLAAALWLALSLLGKGAYALALALTAASFRGLSWLGPRASRFGHSLSASVSPGGGAKRQASNLMTRLRPWGRAPERKQTPDLDPSRLQQAAFIRLRAEHDRLQRRIHVMDRHYEQRASNRAHADAKEWVELRKLALEHGCSTQERPGGNAAAPRGETRPRQPVGTSPKHSHPSLEGRHDAIYPEAPAPPVGHRRA